MDIEKNSSEPSWLQRVRQEQLENYERMQRLSTFLSEVDADRKVSPYMLLLLKKQLEIMTEYDKVLCKRMMLAEVEEYCATLMDPPAEQASPSHN